MCGIIAGLNYGDNQENSNQSVIDQYQNQRSRGTDGFGLVCIDSNGEYSVKRSTHEINALIDLNLNDSKIIIFHHRHPTSSENKISQTHPISVIDGSLKYKYLIIHNGIIQNSDKMREAHDKLGFIYSTAYIDKDKLEQFNDSESLAVEIARFIENQTDTIGAIGSAAFIALKISKKTDKVLNIYYGRNSGNPLNLAKIRDKIRISSEGEGESIKSDTLYSFNLKDFKIKRRKMIIPEAKKSSATNYMPNYSNSFNYGANVVQDSEMENIVEKYSCTIHLILEQFFQSITEDGGLYNGELNSHLKEIKNEMKEALEEAKKYHMETIWHKENIKTNHATQIGFAN